jgi:CHAT domain-containing protein
MVLGPALPAIENKRLVIVADGALQYVPFAALPTTNNSTLIAKHEIVYQPSASALSLIRTASRPTATKTLAVFADPVFDISDQRVRNASGEPKKDASTVHVSREFTWALRDAGDIGSAGGSFRLGRLQYSREEANSIVGVAAPGSFMKATDFDASRANFLGQDLKQFRIVHLATHGILNARHPELSGLVFSLVDKRGTPEDGFLRVGDVYNLNLPIDMVVLSACRTGVGKLVKGEGLIGLTRGFMHAGAARVVASLWKVDDEATAELMKRFYSNMLQRNMPAAAALRRAQLELMETRPSPYFWAGFVLQGEWK